MKRVVQRDIKERGKDKKQAENDFLKSWDIYYEKLKPISKTNNKNKIKKVNAPEIEITIECQINFSARSISLAPMLRAIAELIAPPSAPPDIVCVSINNGKASATAASDFVPNLLINQTSVSTTIDWIKKAMVFGADILISNGTIGFVRNS